MWRSSLVVSLLLSLLMACSAAPDTRPAAVVEPVDADSPCSGPWYRRVEASLMTGDGQGHGPDIGSDEWKSVVEFRLGLRGQAGVPARDTAAWCDYVQQRIDARGEGVGSEPSFDCSAEAGSIPARVCADSGLRQLDTRLSGIYHDALQKRAMNKPHLAGGASIDPHPAGMTSLG